MHNDLIDPKDIFKPKNLEILHDIPSQNLRNKTMFKSTYLWNFYFLWIALPFFHFTSFIFLEILSLFLLLLPPL